MRLPDRKILFALSALLALRLDAGSVLETVSFADGCQTLSNPGSGFAPGSWSSLEPGMSTEGSNLCRDTPNCTKLWSMHKFSRGYVYKDADYFEKHIASFVGGADIPLDENALLAVSNSLVKCRANGGTCIPRFAYTWDGWGGAEPDDFETILRHIAQLGEVLSSFRDVVPAVECGIIGAYGEMHTSRYTESTFQNRVVAAWLENLPGDMALLVRSPPVWMKYLGTTTQEFFAGGKDELSPALVSRMGFYNDGYLGTDYDYGTWGAGGGKTTWSRSEAREFLSGQAVPYGGEMAGVTEEYFDSNVSLLDPARHNIVEEWYDTHLSYLRTIRAGSMAIVKRMDETLFDSAKRAWPGMPELSEYNGTSLRKFCEDHMGFRYVVRDVAFNGTPGRARLEVEIENTGFGQLLFDDAFEIILSCGAQTFRIPNPAASPRSLRSLRGGERQRYVFTFAYPAGIAAGEYDIFLRVRTPLAGEDTALAPRRFVRFANESCIDEELCANRLCKVFLTEGIDICVGTNPWFYHLGETGGTFGGRWQEPFPGDNAAFAVNSPPAPPSVADVYVEMPVEPLDAIPDEDGGIASFVLLAGANGEAIPHAWCRDGWLPLRGDIPQDGETFILHVRFRKNSVEFLANGAPFRDAAGRTELPVDTPRNFFKTVSFAGPGAAGDFSATCRLPPFFFLKVR